jgi:DNA-binding LacI/PurR family transcriptional regulator
LGSIYEVARAAGVSITTVSHVFSGKRPVADDTRRRVLDAARSLDYKPHPVAQGLARGHTMTIGLHFPFEGDSFVLNPYFPELLEGLSAAAAEAGYGFLLVPRPKTRRRRAVQNGLDGIIVADPMADDAYVRALVHEDVPVVTTGRYLGSNPPPWIDNDHRAGIYKTLDHLAAQGYRRPALLSIEGKFSYIEDIEGAFRDYDASLPIVRAADLSEEQAHGLAIKLLESTHAPDAIVAAVDRQAVGVLRAARDLGVRVPEELGVSGEGDTVLARHSHPALTSVRVGARRLGQHAVEVLLQLLNGVQQVESRVLPADLVVRESTLRR